MNNNEQTLLESLKKALRHAKLHYQNIFWIGIVEHENARKYTHEVYWFHTGEDFEPQDDFEDQLGNAETQMCENLQQAYAVAFEKLHEAQNEEYAISVVITDLTHNEEDE